MAKRLIDFIAGIGATVLAAIATGWANLGEFMAWLKFTM